MKELLQDLLDLAMEQQELISELLSERDESELPEEIAEVSQRVLGKVKDMRARGKTLLNQTETRGFVDLRTTKY